FHGGDSPMTVSHLAEARALAARMGSPVLDTALLDAVLVYNLTKAETRDVSRLVRENREIPSRDAVRAVRAHADDLSDADGRRADELPPEEKNLQQRVRIMDQSAAALKSLQHLSAKHLSTEQRDRLVERFEQVHAMTGDALERLTRPPEADRPRRGRRRKTASRRVS